MILFYDSTTSHTRPAIHNMRCRQALPGNSCDTPSSLWGGEGLLYSTAAPLGCPGHRLAFSPGAAPQGWPSPLATPLPAGRSRSPSEAGAASLAWVRARPPSPPHPRPRPPQAPGPPSPAPTAEASPATAPTAAPSPGLTCSGAGCPAGNSVGPAARPRPRSRPPPPRPWGSLPARRGPRGPCGSSSWPECGCPAPRPSLPALSLTAAVYRRSAHAAVNRDTARPPRAACPASSSSSCHRCQLESSF